VSQSQDLKWNTLANSWCLTSRTHCWCYDVCCMYTWLPVAVPFLVSWCFRLCEDPKQCSSILIWVLLGFDKAHNVSQSNKWKYRYPYTKYITSEPVYDKIFPKRLLDKSNAIKTVINFLSFVKPLKTGTNYPQPSTYWCLLSGACLLKCFQIYKNFRNIEN
jgi:hypothetical protein